MFLSNSSFCNVPLLKPAQLKVLLTSAFSCKDMCDTTTHACTHVAVVLFVNKVPHFFPNGKDLKYNICMYVFSDFVRGFLSVVGI